MMVGQIDRLQTTGMELYLRSWSERPGLLEILAHLAETNGDVPRAAEDIEEACSEDRGPVFEKSIAVPLTGRWPLAALGGIRRCVVVERAVMQGHGIHEPVEFVDLFEAGERVGRWPARRLADSPHRCQGVQLASV